MFETEVCNSDWETSREAAPRNAIMVLEWACGNVDTSLLEARVQGRRLFKPCRVFRCSPESKSSNIA